MSSSGANQLRPPIVCYLQRSRLSLALPRTRAVVHLDFPPTIVTDLTVIDQEQYKQALTELIAREQLEPCPVLLILASEVCFQRPLPPGDTPPASETASAALQELRQSMPFTNVFARVIQAKQPVALALNRELYEPLLEAWQENGFRVTTLVPELVFEQAIAPTGLTSELAAELAQLTDQLAACNLLETAPPPTASTAATPPSPDSRRTLILVGIFLVLLVVLAGVWWWTSLSPTPP